MPEYALEESARICEELVSFNFTRENKYGWGVVYKKDPDYIFYSFPEALLGYLGGIAPKEVVLDQNVHMIQNIGRDILKFHSVYFPYLLIAGGVDKTPDDLVVRGFVNINGQKMSKSTGNVISIDSLLSEYDRNAIRLYLLSKNIFKDFDFQITELEQMSHIFTAYKAKLAETTSDVLNSGDSVLFHKNMISWQYDQNLSHFIRLIKEISSFDSLDEEDKRFLADFSKVFIV